jgi:serine protease Do
MFRVFAALLGVMLLGPWSARAGETAWETLFEERVGTVVAVNYTIEREIDRQRSNAVGLVVDDEGLIVLLSSAFPDWLPVDRVTGLEVQLPRSRGERFTAEYLGQDYLNGWHYVRAAPEAWGRMRSIRSFPVAVPRVGEILWGVCLTDETLDFMPYFRDGRLSAAQAFPLLTGFLTADVATPGGPVFDRRGHFAGWAGLANPVEREMWIAGEVYRVNLRNNIESHAFLFAEEFLAQLGRLPPAPDAGPRPWLGVAGLQPLDRDTAEFLGLEDQGAVVVSEILPGSPAAAAGFQPRDIVVAVEGERLRRFKPDSVVQVALERAIRGTAVGQSMNFTVVRGEEELDLTATLAQGPTPVREAAREYFPSLGITLRELVMDDALARRVDFASMRGVLAAFVQPNSPPSAAGLQPGDWILEVDSIPLDSYATAREAFSRLAANEDPEREYVLLVSRNNETSLLRVRRR